MDINLETARRLRLAREYQNYTLEAAAEKIGISSNMLLDIENGRISPTIETQTKIANGYALSISSFAENGSFDTFIPRNQILPIVDVERRIAMYPIVPYDPSSNYEMMRLELMEGCHYATPPHFTSSEECVTLLKGCLELTVGEKCYLLQENDTMHFDATQAHGYRNIGLCTAECIVFINYHK